jgi:hypothetical protein
MASSSRNPVVEKQDRRSAPRFPVLSTAIIELASGTAQRLTAQIVDASIRGMQLKVKQRFERGNMLRIDLPCQELGPVTTVLACVMRADADDEGFWRIGCTFCTELDDDDLQAMDIKRERPANTYDKRTWTRFPTTAQVLYRSMNSEYEPIMAAEVMNASPSGVGLAVDEALEPGTLLDLTVQKPSGQKLFGILACVVYRHMEDASRFIVGCNFIRDLSEKELKMFQ